MYVLYTRQNTFSNNRIYTQTHTHMDVASESLHNGYQVTVNISHAA